MNVYGKLPYRMVNFGKKMLKLINSQHEAILTLNY